MRTQALVAALLSSTLVDPAFAQAEFAAAFADIHRTVAEDFFDPELRGVDWEAIGAEHGARAAAARDLDELGPIVNEMLAHLETSHTRFFTEREPGYFQLLSIFHAAFEEQIREAHPDNPGLRYPGVGMFTERIDGHDFVSGVLDGGPAAAAGLRAGDRIVAVGGAAFHPIGSFTDRVGEDIAVEIQRTPGADGRMVLTVRPEMIDPAVLFLDAMEQSIRIVERGDRRIGYVHLWSYAGPRYHDLLLSAIGFGALRDADALVLDLRDGWGGANPKDLSLFNRRVPIMTQITRDGQRRDVDLQWRKPAALLINGGSRSGKEVFAYGFRKHGIGPLVGSRTAGAVVGGRPYLIRPGMLLYLAVLDVLVDDERLEGVGVAPDVDVPFTLPYANGADPQLEAALEVLASD